MTNPYQPPAFEPPPLGYFQAPPPPGAPPGPVEREVSALDAFRFVFADQNWWKHALYGLLLQLMPLAGPIALAGWVGEVHRRLVWHYEKPVPAFSFDDLGEYMKSGWVAFVAQFILIASFILPLVILCCVLVGFSAGASSTSGAATLAPLLLLLLVPPLALLPFLSTSSTTIAELSENLGQALSPSLNVRYLARIGAKSVLPLLGLILLALGSTLLGLLACCVGVYLSTQVVRLASVHLRWQLYNESLRSGGAHLAIKAPTALPSERRR
jgi:hypothetical protein